jgi:hypothetical protein
MNLRYIVNVKNAKQVAKTKCDLYKKKEIETIKELNHIKDEKINVAELKFDDVKFFYDLTEPVIEFFNSDTLNTSALKKYIDLMRAMIDFAKNIDLFSQNRGAHICLEIDDSNCFNGYIRTSADIYYQISPSPELFLTNFSKLKEYCIET